MGIATVTSGSAPTVQRDGGQVPAQTVSATPSFEAQKAAVAEAATQAPSLDQATQAVKQVNDAFTQNGQNLHAFIEKDKATGIDVVKIQDKNTKEVISQFPSKAIIAMAAAMEQALEKRGHMMDVSA